MLWGSLGGLQGFWGSTARIFSAWRDKGWNKDVFACFLPQGWAAGASPRLPTLAQGRRDKGWASKSHRGDAPKTAASKTPGTPPPCKERPPLPGITIPAGIHPKIAQDLGILQVLGGFCSGQILPDAEHPAAPGEIAGLLPERRLSSQADFGLPVPCSLPGLAKPKMPIFSPLIPQFC